MAVEYINRDSSILGDYQLDLLVEDTECKVDVAMKHFLRYAVDGEHTVAGILGKYFFHLFFCCVKVLFWFINFTCYCQGITFAPLISASKTELCSAVLCGILSETCRFTLSCHT